MSGIESWLERDHVMALDFDRAVTGVSSQPFTLSWDGRGRRVSHTPDYFARLADGSGVVVDVRPADRVGPADAVKFEATAAACAVVGNWSFRLVHELEPVLAANVRWLSGYRHPRHGDLDLGASLRRVFAGGGALLAGVSQVADPLGVLPVLFHLLWRGDLVADLSVPLGDGTWSAAGSRRERAGPPGVLRVGEKVRFEEAVHQVVGHRGDDGAAGGRRWPALAGGGWPSWRDRRDSR